MTTKQQLKERYRVEQRQGTTVAGLPRSAVAAAGFIEAEHPRWPKGHPDGGQFREKEGGEDEPTSVDAPPQAGALDFEEQLGTARDPSWEGPALAPRAARFGLATYDMVANSDLAWRGDPNPAMQYSIDFGYMRETIDRDYWQRDEPLEIGSAEWDKQLASYRDETEEMMRQLAEEGELMITTPDGTVLKDIIKDGRFKSQFETGSSGGAFLPEVRAAQEEMFFGYPQDMPVERRPVYGWLRHPDGEHKRNIVSQYGTVTWHLKPEVKARTTVTFIDSLSRPVVPGPIRNPGWRTTPPPGYEDIGLGTMISDHMHETGLFDGDAIETQYHGGLTLDDVTAVDITVFGGWSVPEIRRINQAEIRALKRRGIRVHFVDEYGDELGEDDVVP